MRLFVPKSGKNKSAVLYIYNNKTSVLLLGRIQLFLNVLNRLKVMSIYRIETADKDRRERWYKQFGLDSLPVKYPQPRYHELPGRSVLAFDLDSRRLSGGAVDSFAHIIAKNEGIPFRLARMRVDSYTLPAANCTVIEESTAVLPIWGRRPFSVFAQAY